MNRKFALPLCMSTTRRYMNNMLTAKSKLKSFPLSAVSTKVRFSSSHNHETKSGDHGSHDGHHDDSHGHELFHTSWEDELASKILIVGGWLWLMFRFKEDNGKIIVSIEIYKNNH